MQGTIAQLRTMSAAVLAGLVLIMGGDGTVPDARHSYGPSGILFYSWKRVVGAPDILEVQLDGSKCTNLTQSKAWEYDPSASPDGSRIVFAAVDRPQDRRADIWVMNADGSKRRRLTHNAIDVLAGAPVWSPDGKSIAFHTVQLDPTGGDLLSPQMYVADADGNGLKRLGEGLAPVWSPDGARLLYIRRHRLPDPDDGLWIIGNDGRNRKPLIKLEMPLLTASAAWSPDGKRIIFAAGRGTEYGIYAANGDRSKRTLLLKPQAEATGLQWLRDGQHLSFTSVVTGPFDLPTSCAVYLAGTDGKGVKKLVESGLTGGGIYGTICVQVGIGLHLSE